MAKRTRELRGNHREIGYREQFDDSPLPSAMELEKYNGVSPEVLPFIIKAAEKEQAFRHDYLGRSMTETEKEGKRMHVLNTTGLWFAFIICMVGFVLGAYLIFLKRNVEGGIFAGTTFVLIISRFILNLRRPAKPQ